VSYLIKRDAKKAVEGSRLEQKFNHRDLYGDRVAFITLVISSPFVSKSP
jgi:hypothetical protein